VSKSREPSQRSGDPEPGTDTPTKAKKNRREGAALQLPSWRFWSVMLSIMIAVFLFALDQLIVATAIPKITVQFNSLSQLPWLASGFL